MSYHSSFQPTDQSLPMQGKILVSYLANDRSFRGIGPKRAQTLYDTFQDDLIKMLSGVDEAVVALIGEDAAICAAATIAERASEGEIITWLDQIKAPVPARLAIRLARAWGAEGLSALKNNPYLLLSIVGWKTVDKIGRASGILPSDERRDVAAIEAALAGDSSAFEDRPGGLAAGDTVMTREDVTHAATRLLGRPLGKSAVNTAITTGAAVAIGDSIQPPGAAWMEAEVAKIITSLSNEAPKNNLATRLLTGHEIDIVVSKCEAQQGFSFTEVQRNAVAAAHRHRAFVLGGYAGSGKTTVLRGVCDSLEAAGRRPIIVTLSGRAAKRAAEATGRHAMTVAKFMVLQDRQDGSLTAGDVLIADEASMLSLVDVWRLLRRLGDASIILCGDPAQLPPIGFGLVFHILTQDLTTPKVILDRVMRQSAESGIPAVAEAIRNGYIPDLPDFEPGRPGVSFISCEREYLCAELEKIGRDLRNTGVGRDDMQIIAPTNREISEINSYFHTKVARLGGPTWPGRGHIAQGEPVMWTKNDSTRELTNGSMGRIIRIDERSIDAKFDGNDLFLKQEDHQFLQLAYAISVHKSQGSQWNTVIAPIFQSKILTRELIYTAITRAADNLVIVGSMDCIRRALSSSNDDGRFTAIQRWLKETEVKKIT